MAPDFFQTGYKDGYCPSCGKFLYDASKIAASYTYCKMCVPDVSTSSPKRTSRISVKLKKKRMNRMQKQSRYGGK